MMVECALRLQYLGPKTPGDVTARFMYDPADPWAVTVDIGGVVWIFARDLLADGLDLGMAGPGDVTVYEGDGPQHLYIDLTSPDGRATFRTGRLSVVAFLAATEELVPPDTERFNADALIAECLRGVA